MAVTVEQQQVPPAGAQVPVEGAGLQEVQSLGQTEETHRVTFHVGPTDCQSQLNWRRVPHSVRKLESMLDSALGTWEPKQAQKETLEKTNNLKATCKKSRLIRKHPKSYKQLQANQHKRLNNVIFISLIKQKVSLMLEASLCQT